MITTSKSSDTLKIDIENLGLSKNNNLKDILDRTSGVMVSENGAISYRGKQINKVYINGKEVFVNQNKIALEKLDVEIMDKVQIIDNHKDRFTLDFNRIRNPIINIDVKKEFRGIFKSEIEGGIGFDEKYAIGGRGFFFSDKFNAFVTSNTNNFGDKDLSQQDILASIEKYKTALLDKILFPFFEKNQKVRENFVSNNSFTIRRESKSNKTGAIIYYGNVRTELARNTNTFLRDTILRNRRFEEKKNGNFISSTINHVQKFSGKTVLKNRTSGLASFSDKTNNTIDNIIADSTTTFLETKNAPKSFFFSNSAKLTSTIAERTIFQVVFDVFYNSIEEELHTGLSNSGQQPINQQLDYSNLIFAIHPSFQFKFNESTLSLGTSFISRNELAATKFINNSFSDSPIHRNLLIPSLPISYEGSLGKLHYNLFVNPTLINSRSSGNRFFFSTTNSLTYKFEPQKLISISVKKNYRFQDITRLLSPLVSSFNNIIFSNISDSSNITTENSIGLRWWNNNASRSISTHATYDFTRRDNFIQSALNSITNNRFNSINNTLDNKIIHKLNLGASKGFYIGKRLNRFYISGDMTLNLSSFPTVIQGQQLKTEVLSWEPSLILSYLPRKFFVREIKNTLKRNVSTFRLDNNEINRQTTVNNTLAFGGGRDKLDWSLYFDYLRFDVNQLTFKTPDINLSFKYELNNNANQELKNKSNKGSG